MAWLIATVGDKSAKTRNACQVLHRKRLYSRVGVALFCFATCLASMKKKCRFGASQAAPPKMNRLTKTGQRGAFQAS
jgi:hypothetical protein